ncbi:MAG: hypothetical protein ACRC33_24155 [Gemmataceae bacterium]
MTFRLDRADLRHWLIEPIPVVLCLYEAATDQTFWIHVQTYFEGVKDFNLFLLGATVTGHSPVAQTWTPASVATLPDAVRSVVQRLRRRT